MSDNALRNANRLKLGLFSPNCEGGVAITTVPERWHATWDNNRALAVMADEAGLEFILPIGRWKGHGGPSGFHDSSLETLTWAAGMLAVTERITMLSTVHVPMIHPVLAAKQMATVDQIGHGRWALNVVCGWNPVEFDMFGLTPLEHGDRYDQGQEWLDVIRQLWRSDEPFDFHGDHYDLTGLIGRPGPFGAEPPIVNAGFSPAGRSFAQRNCDFLFTTLTDVASGGAAVQELRDGAARLGRDVGVLSTAWVVCRPTEQEARDFQHYYGVEHADWEATEALMTASGLHGHAFPEDVYARFRERFSSGHGGYPLVGTPDQVADGLEAIADAGFAGLALGFCNYLDELPYFRDEVLPRLEARGVRTAAASPALS